MRVEVIGDATLYLGDCLEILPTLGKVDAVVTDPPYGIKMARRARIGTSVLATCRQWDVSDWDDKIPPPEFFDLLRSISKHQIIFGGNFFPLPPTSCWLVWDKQNGDNDFADCELAWTNLPKAVRRVYWRWAGMLKKGDDDRVHPTQKPEGVMRWCLGHLPSDAETILDPFMGSGTTGVACMNLGRRFIGIEIEPKYFDIACRRIRAAWENRPRLFEDEPKPTKADLGLDFSDAP